MSSSSGTQSDHESESTESTAIDKREINLLGIRTKPRNYNRGITNDQRQVMSRFGKEYFDDPSFPGYGGYYYNGVWKEPAQGTAEFFQLPDHSRILDVGCGKGFLLYDFKTTNPTFQTYGVDISSYALKHAPIQIQGYLGAASCESLPFENSVFDLVFTASTLHNVSEEKARRAVREITRVGKDHAFIMVHSYTNEIERRNLIQWEATIQTVLSTNQWLQLFQDEGYIGNYWFNRFP